MKNSNKALLHSCAVAAALCAIVGQASAQGTKGDWPMANFDAKGQRYNPYETTLSKTSVKSLQLAWKADLDITTSSPAVVNGMLYIGSNDGHCYALDAATGNTIWSTDLGTATGSSPAVADGVVYIGTVGGQLIAMNAESGAKLWTANLDFKTTSSPTATGKRVFIGDDRGTTYAFNADSGKQVWKVVYPGALFPSAPVVAQGVVYMQNANSTLHAYDAATGAVNWEHAVSGQAGSLATDGHSVYTYGGSLTATDAGTGVQEWQTGIEPDSSAGFALAKHRVYLLTGREPDLWQFSATSGALLGTNQVASNFQSPPTIANDVVYAVSGNLVAASNAKTGKLLWSTPVTGSGVGPVVSHGQLYVSAGSLYAFAPKN